MNILPWFQLLSFMSVSYLTSIKNKDSSHLITVNNEIHVCLSQKFDPELCIFEAELCIFEAEFHITYVNFILSFLFK